MKLGIASGDWLSPAKAPDKLHHWGGSGWARVGQYLPYIQHDFVVGTLAWNRDHLAIIDEHKVVQDVDVILMQRLMHAGLDQAILESRSQGIKVVNDIDDWYWGVSTSNLAFNHNHPKTNPNENINHYSKTLAASDLIICSTPYLRSRVENFVRCPIELMLNSIDTNKYLAHEDRGGTRPIVGWVGSTNHRSNDIETLKGVVDVMARNDDIGLYHGGNALNAPSFASKLGVSEHLVMTAPISTTEMYPSLMIMDIGIIPLANIPFNRAKSDIKGLEYAAAGIPFVAQNLDAYVDLQLSLGIGRLAKKAINWKKHIEELRLNPSLRQEEGAYNRDAVKARDLKVIAKRFVELLDSL